MQNLLSVQKEIDDTKNIFKNITDLSTKKTRAVDPRKQARRTSISKNIDSKDSKNLKINIGKINDVQGESLDEHTFRKRIDKIYSLDNPEAELMNADELQFKFKNIIEDEPQYAVNMSVSNTLKFDSIVGQIKEIKSREKPDKPKKKKKKKKNDNSKKGVKRKDSMKVKTLKPSDSRRFKKSGKNQSSLRDVRRSKKSPPKGINKSNFDSKPKRKDKKDGKILHMYSINELL